MGYYYNQSFKNLKDIYFIDELKKECDRIDDLIKRIEKEKEEMLKRQIQMQQRAEEIMQLEYENYITVYKRHTWKENHIYYDVEVYRTPKNINNKYNNYEAREQLFHERLLGREQGKRKAIKLAEELQVKFRTKDVKYYGFN